MAQSSRRRRGKRKGNIKFKSSAQLVHKNDKTRVHRNSGDTIPRIEGRPPANNAATFKVKIRKK